MPLELPNTMRELPNEMRELAADELEHVSGGCPCRPVNCDCDKPSPRIP
jgi:hypothetical protein